MSQFHEHYLVSMSNHCVDNHHTNVIGTYLIHDKKTHTIKQVQMRPVTNTLYNLSSKLQSSNTIMG